MKTVLFDLDGTLIDSMPIWNDLSFNFLTARGVTPKPDLRDKVSTMFLRESSQYVVDEYNLDCTADDVLDFMHGQIDKTEKGSAPTHFVFKRGKFFHQSSTFFLSSLRAISASSGVILLGSSLRRASLTSSAPISIRLIWSSAAAFSTIGAAPAFSSSRR